YLWSSAAALRSSSTALSQSWLLAASAPSRASLFASLLPCAWATCGTQSARAIIRVRVEYFFFMVFSWTLILFENSILSLQTVGRKQLFTSVREKAPVRCRSLARVQGRSVHSVPARPPLSSAERPR